MSNGAMFPPRVAGLTAKGRAWRKVTSHKDEVRKREQTDGSCSLSKVWALALECGHTAYRPAQTLRPPDRIICKQCEKKRPAK